MKKQRQVKKLEGLMDVFVYDRELQYLSGLTLNYDLLRDGFQSFMRENEPDWIVAVCYVDDTTVHSVWNNRWVEKTATATVKRIQDLFYSIELNELPTGMVI